MSVLEYIYPSDLSCVSIENLRSAIVLAVPGSSVAKVELSRLAGTDWTSFVVRYPERTTAHTILCMAKNDAANKRDLKERYGSHPQITLVLDARQYIWAQLRGSSYILKKAKVELANHLAIIREVLRLGGGVVDLPENQKLYTASGFTRYANRAK